MNKFIIILLVYQATPGLVSILFGHFLYGSFDGKLDRNQRLNFTVYLNELKGLVLYAIDSKKVVLSIQSFHLSNNRTGLAFYYKNKYSLRNVEELCTCTQCSNKYFVFNLRFRRSKLYVKCNNSGEISVTTTYSSSKFNKFPMPKDFQTRPQKIYIWMGNIGPYEGYLRKFFHPLSDQLVGCLKEFYFQTDLITFQQYGDQFLSNCLRNIEEIICLSGICVQRIVKIQAFDCSVWMSNEIFCKKDLSNFTTTHHSLILSNWSTEKNNTMQLMWKKFVSQSSCLAELTFQNGQILTIFIDENNELILHNLNKNQSEMITNVTTNATNVLLISFKDSNFVLKVFNGQIMKYNVYHLTSEPVYINIGFSQRVNICSTFYGQMDFQRGFLNLDKFSPAAGNFKYNTQITSTMYVTSDKKVSHLSQSTVIILISIFVLIFIITTLVIFLVVYYRLHMKNTNIYESEMNLEIASVTTGDDARIMSAYEKID